MTVTSHKLDCDVACARPQVVAKVMWARCWANSDRMNRCRSSVWLEDEGLDRMGNLKLQELR